MKKWYAISVALMALHGTALACPTDPTSVNYFTGGTGGSASVGNVSSGSSSNSSSSQSQGQSMNNGQVISPVQTNSQNLTQSISAPAIDPGIGRNQIAVDPKIPLGVFKQDAQSSNWNVLEDLSAYPAVVEMDEVREMYKGGVDIELRMLKHFVFEFDTCKFFQAGTKPSGKLIGYAFVKSSKTTIDAIAKVQIDAMRAGGNAIVLLSQGLEVSGSSSTIGLGLAYTESALQGGRLEHARSGGGGTGFAHSWGGSKVAHGMVFAIYQQ